MSILRAKTIWTVLIAGSLMLLLPVAIYVLFRTYMSRLITRDNAGIVLQEFQVALNKGAIIHEPLEAAMVAERTYRDRTNAVPLDGWGRRLNITAELRANVCVVSVESAGRDGVMGNDDDVWVRRQYDLSKTGSSSAVSPALFMDK